MALAEVKAMKQLIMIGGAMGTGKTSCAEILVNSVPCSVMLDGDWCWEQGCDWRLDEESKAMALRNICFLLESFLKNSHVKHVFFSWVLHQQSIHDAITGTLRAAGCEFELTDISLMADEDALRERIERRACLNARRRGAAERPAGVDALVSRAMDRRQGCASLDTVKLDVTHLTPAETAREVLRIAGIPAAEA